VISRQSNYLIKRHVWLNWRHIRVLPSIPILRKNGRLKMQAHRPQLRGFNIRCKRNDLATYHFQLAVSHRRYGMYGLLGMREDKVSDGEKLHTYAARRLRKCGRKGRQA
jgi:hypothetical protein